MLNSWTFLAFVLVTWMLFWFIVPRRVRALFLAVVSFAYFFSYYPQEVLFLLELALIVFLLGLIMRRLPKGAGIMAVASVVLLVGILGYYKYADFFIEIYNGLVNPLMRSSFTGGQVVIPLGISYFIFKMIHYLLDIKKGSIASHSLSDFLAYIFFFPILVSGPIERFQPFLAQTLAARSDGQGSTGTGAEIEDNQKLVYRYILDPDQNQSSCWTVLEVYPDSQRVNMYYFGLGDEPSVRYIGNKEDWDELVRKHHLASAQPNEHGEAEQSALSGAALHNQKNHRLVVDDMLAGLPRIISGLFKKMVLADSLAATALLLQQPDLTTGQYWAASLAFTFQLYFDFSGYSDLAIGISRLFGYRIMENFNWPYLSRNVSEFWKRWHMSLTSWFRDYIFIPLGGSRGSLGFVIRNTLIVMFVTGLWHGAGYHFIFWGMYHAFGLIILRLYRKFILGRLAPAERWLNTGFASAASTLLTFVFVNVGWVLFACETEQSIYVIQQMFGF